MISDLNTKAGQEEILRRLKKRKEEASEVRKQAQEELDSEPVGKLTHPNDLDRMRDRDE